MRERAFHVFRSAVSLLLGPLHHDVCDALPSGTTAGCPDIRTGKP